MEALLYSFEVDRQPETRCGNGMHRGPKGSFDGKVLLNHLRSNLVSELCKTDVVLRLRDVSFLGAIDYTRWANKTQKYLTSRLDHSIGVACLAARAADRLSLTPHQRDTALAAALLHDAGHGPLSHSLEAAFEKAFGINHHKATQELILGGTEKSRALRVVLRAFSVDAEEVVALLNGELDHPLTGMFSGPINFDTIEGILRAGSYQSCCNAFNLSGHEVVDALVALWDGDRESDAVRTLDRFWQAKGLVYSQLVRGRVGVVSDFKCQIFFEKNFSALSPELFSFTEKLLKEQFPELFAWLEDDEALPKEMASAAFISYVRRSFELKANEECASKPKEFLCTRYRQKKSDAVLEWTRPTTYREGIQIWEWKESLSKEDSTARSS